MMRSRWVLSYAASAVLLVLPAIGSAQLVTSISNNRLWLDGADMNGDNVFDTGVGTAAITQWNDKSGNTFHVTNPTVASTPLQAYNAGNGLSAGRFDQGTQDKLDNTALNVAGVYTVLAVVKPNYTAGTGHILSGINGAGTDAVLYRPGTNYNFYSGQPGGDGGTDLTFGSFPDTTSFHLVGVRINNLGADLQLIDGAANSTEYNGLATLNGIRIGNLDRGNPNNVAQSEAWGGDIAEVVVFNKLLNTAERRVLENHFVAKWAGATLGVNDRYSFDAAGIDYDFGVIGIGREADGALTTSSDKGLRISEANSSLANGEYVIAGTKQLTNSFVNTLVPAGVEGRMSRVWAIDETGGDVDVTLSFNVTDPAVALPLNPTFFLLRSATDGGPFTALNLPFSFNGTEVSFTVPGSQLTSGFFTLGATSTPEPASLVAFLLVGAMGLAFARRCRRCR